MELKCSQSPLLHETFLLTTAKFQLFYGCVLVAIVLANLEIHKMFLVFIGLLLKQESLRQLLLFELIRF